MKRIKSITDNISYTLNAKKLTQPHKYTKISKHTHVRAQTHTQIQRQQQQHQEKWQPLTLDLGSRGPIPPNQFQVKAAWKRCSF